MELKEQSDWRIAFFVALVFDIATSRTNQGGRFREEIIYPTGTNKAENGEALVDIEILAQLISRIQKADCVAISDEEADVILDWFEAMLITDASILFGKFALCQAGETAERVCRMIKESPLETVPKNKDCVQVSKWIRREMHNFMAQFADIMVTSQVHKLHPPKK